MAYAPEKIIIGADANNEKVAVSGWQEESELELIPFVQKYQSNGIQYVICTDISKDGMLQGPSFQLYKKMLSQTKKGNGFTNDCAFTTNFSKFREFVKSGNTTTGN